MLSAAEVCKAHLNSIVWHADIDVVLARISKRRDRTWRKPHRPFAHTPRMPLHGCEAATVTPSGDKKEVASSWISTGWQRLRQMRPRQERQLAKERKGSTKKAAVRSTRRCVVGRRLQRA